MPSAPGSSGTCPRCGAPVHTSLAEGLCPACLTQQSHPRSRPKKAGAPEGLRKAGLSVGMRLNEYEIREEIDRGRHGIVFRAYQHGLNREVALKVLSLVVPPTQEDVNRFRTEAKAVAPLTHPNIVPVYDVQTCGSFHFFSMRLIVGSDLADPFRSPRFRPGDRSSGESAHQQQVRIANLISTVARAVHHAHQQGILHCDLKPKNILLDSEGTPYVTDFGLARQLKSLPTSTTPETLVGTPQYMAPELALSPGDARETSDVYSLGIVLYELLTHRPPFEGATPQDTLALAREQEPGPLRTSARPVEPDLENICLKCIRKEPNQRYESALALADDLDRFVDGRPVLARPVSGLKRTHRWARRHPDVAILAVGVVVLVLLIGVGMALTAARLSDLAARLQEANRETNLQLVNTERRARSFLKKESALEAIRAVAGYPTPGLLNDAIEEIVWPDFGTNFSCAVHTAPGIEVKFAPNFKTYIETSPDGRARCFNCEQKTSLWSLSGTVTNRLEELYFDPTGQIAALQWTNGRADFHYIPDGHLMWSTTNVGHITFRSDGAVAMTGNYDRQHDFFRLPTGEEIHVPPIPGFRPDQIVFDSDPQSPVLAGFGADQIIFWNWIEGRQVRSLTVGPMPMSLAWSGDELFVGFEDGEIQSWNLRSSHHRRYPGHHRGVKTLQVISNGLWMLSRSEDQESILWDIRSGVLVVRTSDPQLLQLRSDGNALAFAQPSAADGGQDWKIAQLLPSRELMEAELQDTGAENVRSMSFNRDGSLLLATKQAGIHQITMGSNQQPEFLTVPGALGTAFTPDPRVIFISTRRQLLFFGSQASDAPGSHPMNLGDAEASHWFGYGSQSTNGLYCVPDANGPIQIIDLANRKVVQSLPVVGIWHATLSPCGRWIAAARRNDELQIWDRIHSKHLETLKVSAN